MRQIKVGLILTPRIQITGENKIAGTERVFLNDVKNLRNAGYTIAAFARFSNIEQGIFNLSYNPYLYKVYLFLSVKRNKFLQILAQFIRILLDTAYAFDFFIRARDCDLFISHSFPLIAIFAPMKSIILMQALWQVDFKSLFSNRYKKCFFLFCSRSLRDEFHKMHSELKSDLRFVLYNSVNKELFFPKKTTLSHSSNYPLKLLYASAWVKEKGIDLLIEAFKQIPSQFRKNITLTISANKEHWYSDFQEENKSFAKKISNEIKQNKNIHELGGIKYEQMPSIYRSHDVLVFPSVWREPFGLVVLEALACGLPVICFNEGSIGEIVTKQNAYLLKTMKSETISKAIVKIYKNKAFLKKKVSLLTQKNKPMLEANRINLLTNYMTQVMRSRSLYIRNPSG